MGEDKQQPGRHWSKDFVEHLRTVHFTLIAVCIAVIILASTRTKSEINRAHDQIKQLRILRDTWDKEWVQKTALVKENHFSLCTEDENGCTLMIETTHHQTLLLSLYKTAFVELPGAEKPRTINITEILQTSEAWHPIESISTFERALVKQPNSIKEFKEIWNTLNGGAVIHSVATLPAICWFRKSNGAKFTKVSCHWIKSEEVNPSKFERADLSEATDLKDLAALGLPSTSYFYQAPVPLLEKPITSKSTKPFGSPGFQPAGEAGALVLPVLMVDTKINPLSSLINQHPEWGWQPGSFDVAFRDLSNVSKAYQDSNLDTAEAIVAGEEARTGESLDAFGLKFPAETAIRWGAGAALVLIVQLYFWAHLFEFRRKLSSTDEGWNVAWVGVYETRPARIMLYGSLLILPLAGISAVGIRGLYISGFKWYSWLLLSGTVSAAVLLSILICFALPRKKELI